MDYLFSQLWLIISGMEGEGEGEGGDINLWFFQTPSLGRLQGLRLQTKRPEQELPPATCNLFCLLINLIHITASELEGSLGRTI